MSKPFSQACENNKDPILNLIRRYYRPGETVLEIGSGTAQHVRYFAEKLPAVTWQPSDTPDSLPQVMAGLAGEEKANILPPLALDVAQPRWPLQRAAGVFSANTLHIMSQIHVPHFFRGAGEILVPGAHLCVYGPFKVGGQFTSDSNARFEQWLKNRDPASGIRDLETVNGLAAKAGMTLVAEHAMPANNMLLVWTKMGSEQNY